jgi:SP family facilitated glucose transporter-like MFS transporter 12
MTQKLWDDRRILVQHVDEEQNFFEDEDNEETGYKCCYISSNVIYLSSCVAAIGGVLFGYDVGVISGAKVQVAHVMGLSCGQEEALVSFMPLGAVSASLVAGKLINRFGRKWSIQVSGVAFTLGSIMMALANSLAVLLLGRFIVGFAVSLSAMSECLYISEISKPNNRGMLVSFNELGITLGFLLAFIINYLFVETADGWRIMFAFSSGLSVLQLISMCFLPRTPHFLISRSRDSEAVTVLKLIHRDKDVGKEMTNIRQSLETSTKASCSNLFSMEENMLHRTMIGLTIVVLLQVTGQPNILYYAVDIFQAVGFCTDSSAATATVGLGLMKVGATLVSLLLVDKVGRRSLLLVGSVCMAVCLLILTVFAGYQYAAVGYHQRETCSYASSHSHQNNMTTLFSDAAINKSVHTHKNLFSHVQHTSEDTLDLCHTDNQLPFGLRYIGFVALVLYVAAFSFSFGPITWILLTELFPVSMKAEAMSLGQAVSWTANVFVSVTFLDAVRILSLPFVFFVYLVFALFAIGFIYKFIPETKGKSLEDISKELDKNIRTKISNTDSKMKRSIISPSFDIQPYQDTVF